MPREAKKRGRRAAQKRSRDEPEADTTSPKRRRTDDNLDEPAEDYIALPSDAAAEVNGEAINGSERRYYGMLDEHEQEYFKNADQMLDVNQFRDVEERSLFIENLHKEAAGKELKLACGQTSSRVLERLVWSSTPDQLKHLFQQFEGEYIHLMSHRFASHCCETLFSASASTVSDELATAPVKDSDEHEAVAMEAIFLSVINEIGGDLGYMITDKFASHCLRLLLTILSGKPMDLSERKSIDRNQHKSIIAGKRKEKIGVAGSIDPMNDTRTDRPVPQSFLDSLHGAIDHIVAGLDTTSLRSFATHPIANPTLQLLLQLELELFGKHRGSEEGSLLKKLLPEETITKDSESASFINGLLFDPVGSHLLETIVEHAPGKLFKNFYKELLKDRLSTLARHDTASYVVCRVLERLGSKDLQDASKSMMPEIPTLAERGRMNVFRTLAERLHARDVDAQPFVDALKVAYSTEADEFSISKLLQLPENLPNPPASTKPEIPLHIITSPSQNAASVFVQALLKLPGPLSKLVFDSLCRLDFPYLRCIAHTSPLSPMLQAALSSEAATVIFRRKLATHFYGSIAEFSISASASHVIDAVEVATRKSLAFVRERIAEELSESEAALRESTSGRKVWRNWNMDLYRRDRERWIKDTRHKVGNNGFQSFPGLLGEADVAAKEKGKDHFGRALAAMQESVNIGCEAGKNAHEVVHNNVCEPIRLQGRTALDRARERYAQQQKT